MMKRLVLVMLLCAVEISSNAEERDSLLVMFWNMENFFDWIDQGTGESDREFSSSGSRHWTRERFYTKCDAMAKSLMWIGDSHGRMPDILGLAEIENRGVLTKLLNTTLLRKYDYRIVHFDSGDRRGIDVALLYRSGSIELLSTSLRTPMNGSHKMDTRDILHARMVTQKGTIYDFVVNHHPSKYGGAEVSDLKRKSAMKALKDLCDSLVRDDGGSLVIMGDFNDAPDGEQFDMMTDILENQGIVPYERGEGTIRYKGKWELIDMFLTGKETESSEMSVVRIPFLMEYDRSYPGEKPLRTYSGPRYLGGVSDHCPILIWLYD